MKNFDDQSASIRETDRVPSNVRPVFEFGMGDRVSIPKKKKKRVWPWILLGLLIFTVVLVWMLRPWQREGVVPQRFQATATAARQDIMAGVLATGKILPQVGAEVNVGSRISGQLERLYVGVGDMVKKGQVIAVIDRQALRAQVAESEAKVRLSQAKLEALKEKGPTEITRSKAELAEKLASFDFYQAEFSRSRRLKRSGVVSAQSLEQAAKEYEIAKAKLEVARKNVELAEIGFRTESQELRAELAEAGAVLAKDRIELDYAVIKAPLSGVVASVSTREGETVAAGLSAPTFVTIVDLDRLQLDAYVDEVDIGRIKVGQSVVFTVDTWPEKEFQGHVTAIYPRPLIQENVVTYDCIVDIDTPYSGLLKPEMTTNVNIVYENRENVLVLPVQAVKRRAGKSLVYRTTADGYEEIEVKTGWRDDTLIEIVAGISEGNTVLLEPDTSSEE